MLRQIYRYCKPHHVDFFLKHKNVSSPIINNLSLNKNTFLCYNLKASFHSSSSNNNVFIDHENIYAHKIVFKDFLPSSVINVPENDVSSTEWFQEVLAQNWRDSNIDDIVTTFYRVKNFCIKNGIAILDTRFDNLVDGLMDNCEHIKDDQLIGLLYCLSEYPPVESYKSHNFHDVWSCLDDICCWKIIEWDMEKSFTVANAWYKLRLGKHCDYIYTLINRTAKRADDLTKEQLLSIYFYLNVYRKRAVDFEYEFALEKLVNDMDIDEMGVVAMGYFKTKTKIKLVNIQEALAKKVIENSSTAHDITLTAILKVLRYSKPFKIIKTIEQMVDKLYPEIDRLSDLCCTHLALMSTGIQTYNKRILQKVSQKFVKNITNTEVIRFKDIERVLNVLSMFNYDPKTNPDIFKACYEEIHKTERLAETVRYARCLACALNYLSLRNMYSHELMNRILDEEYITSVYGKGARLLPREIFSLDCSIDIECPDYKGNRLPPRLKYKAAKWLTEFTPSYNQWKKLTAADKLILDTIDAVSSVVGGEKFMHINFILPHFSRADIVVCKNTITGKVVEPVGFQNYVLGDVMFPHKDKSLEWFAITVLGWNNTVKDTNIPLGHFVMKQRQLRKIGYTPVFVIWSEFQNLSTDMMKQYISTKLGLG
uniref:FAST kinase domain-containing protein 5, mitochondrial n=1 Tax=Diabrotica virgifera virgifera TaxID=50390 RepID=A0A6P7F9H3_DIAVI